MKTALAAPAPDPGRGPHLSPLDALLPGRTSGQVQSRTVTVHLGMAGSFDLAVLPIRENRLWKQTAEADFGPVLTALEDDANDSVVVAYLEQFGDTLLSYVVDYDQRGARAWGQDPALPSLDDLEAVVTPQDAMVGFLALWAAANPFSVAVTVGSAVATARQELTSPGPTSGRPRSTGGRRTRSKAN